MLHYIILALKSSSANVLKIMHCNKTLTEKCNVTNLVKKIVH